ncbi:MAG TPA: UDP-N-acetylmuramate dehydrogenase [Vicinamibacterales bacterium]|jgi:UDP-N-acetylmuramate dehydrogenase|nr:UDP-N-acetylmuramate dehydrogenase [Vicinamibacterales bacterium]
MKDFTRALEGAVGGERVRTNFPLAGLTTFRVGGSADWFVETRSSDELVACLRLSSEYSIPFTVLGGGSNVLISDLGIRGLVVRPRGGEIARRDEHEVTADAAVTINGLVRWTVLHGAAGLEAWAGTPGTVGGAICGNAHFGGRLIGEHVLRTRLADREGSIRDVAVEAMEFGYDRSRLQQTGEVLLTATFRVRPGDPQLLRATARQSLAFRKRTQPLDSPSAGCIFQNPDPKVDQLPPDLPYSAGALVDRAGLKGLSIGGATVSPTHGNFIVNEGAATAEDVRSLIARCRDEVRRQFGVELREEIVYLGDFGPPTDAA